MSNTAIHPEDQKRWDDLKQREELIKSASECKPHNLRWMLWLTKGTPWNYLYAERFLKEKLCFHWDEELRDGCGKKASGFYTVDKMPYCEEHMGERIGQFLNTFQLIGGSVL